MQKIVLVDNFRYPDDFLMSTFQGAQELRREGVIGRGDLHEGWREQIGPFSSLSSRPSTQYG